MKTIKQRKAEIIKLKQSVGAYRALMARAKNKIKVLEAEIELSKSK